MFTDNGVKKLAKLRRSEILSGEHISLLRSLVRRAGRRYKHPAPTELNGREGGWRSFVATWQCCDLSNTLRSTT